MKIFNLQKVRKKAGKSQDVNGYFSLSGPCLPPQFLVPHVPRLYYLAPLTEP
jgi:hypothetical protein